MRSYTVTSHTLQMSGPRGQIWRSTEEVDSTARVLADQGKIYEALLRAEEAYCERHKSMHGVRFRVKTQSTTYTFWGDPEGMLNE